MQSKTYKAVVKYAGDDYFIGVPPSGHAQIMDANSERNAGPTPLENLLVAVAGCTAYDVQSILKKKRQDVTDYRVEIEGVRKEDRPQAFIKFHIKHIVTGRNISEKAIADAIELSDKTYCSVAATVRPTAEIETGYQIIDASETKAHAQG